jgi:DNA-binding response OmpR family regulator
MDHYTILVLEDDELLRRATADYFQMCGYSVLSASTGEAFKQLLQTETVHVVLLDLRLPDSDGMDLLRELRKASDVLLMVVSGSRDERERILALTLGADDFLVKPVSPRELELRARNLLARQRQRGEASAGSAAGNESANVQLSNLWWLDRQRKALVDPQRQVHSLTRAEFALLNRLSSAGGAIVERNELFNYMSTHVGVSNIETLSTLIYRLRRKLPAHNGEDVIVTLSKVGYRINLAPTDATQTAQS